MRIEQGDIIEIKGQKYVVLSAKTANEMQDTCPNMAKVMRNKKIAYDLYLRKPKGRRVFTTCLFEDSTFSSIIQVW